MKKNILISIGIIAYNESANIKLLLNSLAHQKLKNIKICEVILISDGSNDKTTKNAEKARFTNLNIIKHKERRGKIQRLNELAAQFKGDILVQLDADTILFQCDTLENIVEPIIKNGIDLVAGKSIPFKAKSFIEQIINHSVNFKLDLYENISSENVYLCKGQIRAFSKKFAKRIVWIDTAGEDAFSYFFCKTRGYKFVYVSDALVRYKSPMKLSDHFLQSVRFIHSQKAMERFFPVELVRDSYFIPKKIFIKSMSRSFINNPVYFLSFVMIFLFGKCKAKFVQEEGSVWRIAGTSKVLI